MVEKQRSQSNNRNASDAVALLKADHEKVRELLSSLEETTARGVKKREQLLKQIGVEIRVHAKLEEEIFYPAYKAAAESKEDEKLFFEAKEEHALVDVVLPLLEDTDAAADEFGARAKVLKDLIEHHAGEEETEMFPLAKKLLGRDRLVELGDEMSARKEELMRDLQAQGGRTRATRATTGPR